ncbi:LytTR family DNA-binding domain-containing protein [Vallitalea okinawensis]|uniref:LytTR family DNA-binding domain-containing protein n=1 Tax=Vallitalea okinawensis TaxID=2078660 RepID=UPI000CFD6985|nr:LytTR family DNA-binding domain-containing protein [Vallitalea okinawensis]
MKVKLICNEKSRAVLTETLKQHQITIDEQANLILSERDMYHREYFSGKVHDSISVIKRSEIVFFEAIGNDVFCITREGRYKVEKKLYELESMLFQHSFIRVNKSYIINILKIEEIIPWIGSKYILKMINGDEIDVTRTYYRGFKAMLGL